MGRWKKDTQKALVLLGKLGDTVDFAMLPEEVQSEGMARFIGARRGPGLAAEACGSPGEVSNEPSLGHRLHFWQMGPLGVKGFEEMLPDRAYSGVQAGKAIVHVNVALSAPDQLRQRVAWALSQVYVVSEEGLLRGGEQEIWHTYYDIFTRNGTAQGRRDERRIRLRAPAPAHLVAAVRHALLSPSPASVSCDPPLTPSL